MGDILKIIMKRLGLGLVTLLVISIIIFGAVELLPGDIAQAVLGQGATEENLAALRKELGLDRAAPIRYFEWLGNAVTGDFGNSLISKTPVSEAIGTRYWSTNRLPTPHCVKKASTVRASFSSPAYLPKSPGRTLY